MNSHELMEQDFPLVYELGVDSDAFWISVGPEVADAVETQFIHTLTEASSSQSKSLQSRIQDLESTLALPKFELPFRREWGFGKVIQTEQFLRGEPVKWSFVFPTHRSFFEKHIDKFHQRMLCVSASLQLLFRALHIITPPKSEQRKQLVMVNGLMAQLGQNGSALSVTLSKALCESLKQQSQYAEKIEMMMQEAMKAAHKKMMRQSVDNDMDHWFRTKAEGKMIMLSCPGNACGLTPDDRTDDASGGYELVSHNTDSPIQQITLLCGIAALYTVIK